MDKCSRYCVSGVTVGFELSIYKVLHIMLGEQFPLCLNLIPGNCEPPFRLQRTQSCFILKRSQDKDKQRAVITDGCKSRAGRTCSGTSVMSELSRWSNLTHLKSFYVILDYLCQTDF